LCCEEGELELDKGEFDGEELAVAFSEDNI
jgi:hypothetical protein